jgi:hypothetical protein
VIVIPKGDGPTIAGFLVREDPAKVVLREELQDGTFQEREIPRSEIDELIVTVDAERLESLRPDDPHGYRDYAEELAVKRRDPEARAMAVRLYLIAAYLAPEKLGRSCLMGMAALADGPAERRKFRAMAYLLDPAHNRELLERSEADARGAPTAPDADRGELVDALRLLRQGKYGLAQGKAESVEPLFDRYGRVLSRDEFIETCQSAPDAGLPDDLLRGILRLELTLSEPTSPEEHSRPAKGPAPARWLRIIATGGHKPVPSLSLETITEFDPCKCVFRRGRWVEP